MFCCCCPRNNVREEGRVLFFNAMIYLVYVIQSRMLFGCLVWVYVQCLLLPFWVSPVYLRTKSNTIISALFFFGFLLPPPQKKNKKNNNNKNKQQQHNNQPTNKQTTTTKQQQQQQQNTHTKTQQQKQQQQKQKTTIGSLNSIANNTDYLFIIIISFSMIINNLNTTGANGIREEKTHCQVENFSVYVFFSFFFNEVRAQIDWKPGVSL